MRVAVLGPVHPYRGGIAHHTARLARAFSDAGHEVRVYNFTRQYPAFLFPGTTQTDASGVRFEAPSERVLDTLRPRSWVLAARRIREFGARLLVIPWWHPYFTAAVGTVAGLARASGIEVVYLCHNVLPHEPGPADRILTRLMTWTGDRFVVQARAEIAKLRALRSDARVGFVAHPPYDQFVSDISAPTREEARVRLAYPVGRVILFFGLIRPYKGLDVLIDALAAIPEAERPFLHVAGEVYGDERHYLDRIRERGVGRNVRFDARYVPNEEVPVLMAGADAVVLPYLHATQSGIVQVAFAAGRPVITTRVGGLPDVVEDGKSGLLVEPGDPGALAAAIRRFYSGSLRERLESGARAAGSTDGWQQMVHALVGPPGPGDAT